MMKADRGKKVQCEEVRLATTAYDEVWSFVFKVGYGKNKKIGAIL